LFSVEEWQDLDASLGDDWKAIQVQYNSDLILTSWGVYVYKQETSMDDIKFRRPNCNSFPCMPSSCLVPKGSLEQKMKHFWENLDPRCYSSDILESEKGLDRWVSKNALLQGWMNAKADIMVETSSSVYGLSLKQDHEDYVDNESIKVLEMATEINIETLPKVIAESFPENIRFHSAIMERFALAGSEFMNGNKLSIKMVIVLEYSDRWGAIHRRFWGILEIKWGDPFYKPVLKRMCQITWEKLVSNEPEGSCILELKCQCLVNEETSSSSLEETSEEENNNPELEELMRMIEQDVMSLNRSYLKMKASIALANNEPISRNHLNEARLLKKWIVFGKWPMVPSLALIKTRPYGKIRVWDDPFRIMRKCLWFLVAVLVFLPVRCLSRLIRCLFSATIIGQIARLSFSNTLLLNLESLLEADLSKRLIISGRWTMFASAIVVLIGSRPLLKITPNGIKFFGLSFFLFVLIRCLFFVCLQFCSVTLTGMALRRFLLYFLLNYFESLKSIIRYIIVYLKTLLYYNFEIIF
jgi:hypothetical protein